ncbi:MAG TPA: tetratricopeptide repeat protein [Pyrinomonadaceae bacterium]
MAVYEFGPFRLDVTERLLLRDGQSVPITAKLFDLLLLLIEHSGHLITKEELMRRVWPGVSVEDGNLTVSVSKLRKLLGENHKDREYIETIPWRGYRFAAKVKEVRGDGAATARASKEMATAGEQKAAGSSVAVLPLVKVGTGSSLDFLSDGITESIINSLSQLPGLRVMARATVFRYKGREVSAEEAGEQLGVETVVVGRMFQLNDELVGVNIELIKVADGSQIWGEQYYRKLTDILTMQEDIATEISDRLRHKLTGEERSRLARRYTNVAEAYECYLKGRYFWNKYTKNGIEKGIAYFERAIELDPDYALAYSGLADCYFRLSNLYLPPKEALPKAKAVALKAVELDDALAEAHASLGLVKFYYDHDWAGTEREYRLAIKLNPYTPIPHQRYSVYLAHTGRFDEAIVECKKALKFDPLSLQVNVWLGACLYLLRRYNEATEQLSKVFEIDPDFFNAHILLAMIKVQEGKLSEAVAQFKRTCQIEPTSTMAQAYLGYAYGLAGRRAEAEQVLEKLDEAAAGRYVSPFARVVVYVGLDDKEKALEWLEVTFQDHNDYLTWLKVGPELDSLRAEPRFQSLLRRVGFDDD